MIPLEPGHNLTRPTRMESVIAATCAEMDIDPLELGFATRHPKVVLAREIATFIARECTRLSYPEIARAIGRPNHSTVITAFGRIAERMKCHGTEFATDRDRDTFKRVNSVRITLNLPLAVLPPPMPEGA